MIYWLEWYYNRSDIDIDKVYFMILMDIWIEWYKKTVEEDISEYEW